MYVLDSQIIFHEVTLTLKLNMTNIKIENVLNGLLYIGKNYILLL